MNNNNPDVQTTNQVTSSQITHFYDANNDWVYDRTSEQDSTFAQAQAEDTSLEHFFKRPLKIASFPWQIGTPYSAYFNPWNLYLSNPRVANRMNNYNNLRANLCLKFNINGNGFYYGRLLVSYIPLSSEDELSRSPQPGLPWKIAPSQRPHIYLDPTTSQGGQMKLPFVFWNDYVSIPEAEWLALGSIAIDTLTDLKHANGATESVIVSIFAWLEDVAIATPTSVNTLGLEPQSGDEYSSSPISTPAAVVANAAEKLKDIPYIGKYALVTSHYANMTAAAAKLLGFSRPPVVEDIHPFKPTFGNFANTTAADTVSKLTFDAKQETTVDSRVVGLDGQDEMSMKYFLSRESYFTSFPWPNNSDPEICLWSTYITPKTFDSTASAFGRQFHMTPICYGCAPFVHWRGSIKYRFQVVCSNFHKGRLKVVYEPYAIENNDYLTNYTRVIDISSERDFTITCGWGNQRHFLEFGDFNDETPVPFELGPISTPQKKYTNGILSVYVVNDLTVPNSTVNNDITINVFISAGEDFEVANPDDAAQAYFSPFPTSLEPQSGEEQLLSLEFQSGEEQDLTPLSSAPVIDQSLTTMAPMVSNIGNTYKVFFGDPVGSIRQIVKRYNYHSLAFFDPEATFGFNWWEDVRNDFPCFLGATNDGIFDLGAYRKNLCKTTMLNWFTPCYVCRRGGIRWKYVMLPSTGQAVTDNRNNSKNLQVRRVPHYNTQRWGSYGMSGNIIDTAAIASRVIGNIWAGGIMHNTNNQTVEVELPFHTSRRFYSARNLNILTRNNFGVADLNATSFHEVNTMQYGEPGDPFAMGYVAGADDFSLSFFLSIPTMYYHDPNGPFP